MSLYNALIRTFDSDSFSEFCRLLHDLIRLDGLNIANQLELIEYLSKYITEDNEDDDGCDRYLSRRDMAYCAINLVLVEMKQKFGYEHYEIEGEYIIEKDSFDDTYHPEDGKKIRLGDLEDILKEIKKADEYNEYADFLEDLKEIKDSDLSKSSLQLNLLELIDVYDAHLVAHMLYFLRSFESEDELKKYDRINHENYTAEALKKKVGEYNSESYCYSFLDLASDEERREMNSAMADMKAAETPKKLIIAISKQDALLRRWMANEPLLPYTTYKLMTDYFYHTKFFEDVEYDETNVVESADMEREDFAALIKEAMKGDVEAQHELGIKYIHLSSETIHQNKAKYWLKRASDGGLVKSQIVYGALLYKEGKVLEAIELYKRAAECGNSEAQYRVGVAYADGLGVERNIDKARKWLTLSAQQGHFLAKFRLDNLK